jgi:hypothetical protein
MGVKRIERILLKLVVIQFIFLLIVQFIILYTPFSPYLGKIYDYEGVSKNGVTKTIETFDQ